tara:strand:- start:346 stop:1071 length:726 start_codon:yes stop_codon:yes gene_type:complete
MNSKYFNITVKPNITGANAVTAFANDDLMFDWTEFFVPKGGARLVGVTSIVRGTNGVRQEQPMDLYFAKASNGDVAPGSLGTVNSSVSGIGYFNNLLGCLNVPVTDYRDGLDYMAVAHTNNVATGPGFVMADLTHETGYKGFNKYYLGVVAKGAFDFGTGVLADDAISVGDTGVVVKTVDPRKVFAPGDVLVDNGNAAIGTIKSIEGSENFTLTSGATEAVASDDEIVNKNPVTFILHFER